MALILSEHQIERVLDDGYLALFPSYTEDGKVLYTHICDGAKYAKIHGRLHAAFNDVIGRGYVSNEQFVHIAPHVTKVDALGPVEFYPSFVYDDWVDMSLGSMEEIMQYVMRAILRPIVLNGTDKRDQFLQSSSQTVPFMAAAVIDSIRAGDSKMVELACKQEKSCMEHIQTYLNGRSITWEKLNKELTAKWS